MLNSGRRRGCAGMLKDRSKNYMSLATSGCWMMTMTCRLYMYLPERRCWKICRLLDWCTNRIVRELRLQMSRMPYRCSPKSADSGLLASLRLYDKEYLNFHTNFRFYKYYPQNTYKYFVFTLKCCRN